MDKKLLIWQEQTAIIKLGEFARIVFEAGVTKGKLEAAENRLNRVKK